MPALNCGTEPLWFRPNRRQARRGRRGMGIIVQFPEGHRPLGGGRYVDAGSEPASVIILPVVRIEREAETATELRNSRPSIRRRKRPASRA